MAGSEDAPVVHGGHSGGSVSVPMVVGVAALVGVGLIGTAYWLVTLDWRYFASLLPLVVGAYLLFTRATGADRA